MKTAASSPTHLLSLRPILAGGLDHVAIVPRISDGPMCPITRDLSRLSVTIGRAALANCVPTQSMLNWLGSCTTNVVGTGVASGHRSAP